MKEGNTYEGVDRGRWRERWWERELQQLERGKLKEETEREENREGEKWRENVFNYSALPMFSIYGPFKEASGSYIYIHTHTVGTGCSLKYSSPGKFQPKKQGKHKEKCDKILIREMHGSKLCRRERGWIDRGGKTRKQNHHGDVRSEREKEREGKLKLTFSLQLLVYHHSWPIYFSWQGNCNKKQQPGTTFQDIF